MKAILFLLSFSLVSCADDNNIIETNPPRPVSANRKSIQEKLIDYKGYWLLLPHDFWMGPPPSCLEFKPTYLIQHKIECESVDALGNPINGVWEPETTHYNIHGDTIELGINSIPMYFDHTASFKGILDTSGFPNIKIELFNVKPHKGRDHCFYLNQAKKKPQLDAYHKAFEEDALRVHDQSK